MPVRDVECKIGNLEFPPERDRPEVSNDSQTATAKVETIDSDPIIQKLGPGTLNYTFHGEVFTRGANYLTALRRNDMVKITHRRVGTIHAVVTDISCTSTNIRNQITTPERNGPHKDYRHTFDLSVVVAKEINPPPGAYLGQVS